MFNSIGFCEMLKLLTSKCTMSSTTSLATIQSLCKMFACVGLPEQVITDNGCNFVSEEFKELTQKNEIKHTTSAPNGAINSSWVQSHRSSAWSSIDPGEIIPHLQLLLYNHGSGRPVHGLEYT